MPNYCQNTLYVSHKNKAEIDNLLTEATKEEPKLFDAIRPTPPELLEKGWYEWRLQNWGTKWNPIIGDCDKQEDGTLRIEFDTAWSPPIELYDFMTANGFDIEAFYSEDGMCFRGSYTSEYGDQPEDYEPEDTEEVVAV